MKYIREHELYRPMKVSIQEIIYVDIFWTKTYLVDFFNF